MSAAIPNVDTGTPVPHSRQGGIKPCQWRPDIRPIGCCRTLVGTPKHPLDWTVRVSIFDSPEAHAEGDPDLNQLKEFIMNDAMDLELVDLGDAKEETKGVAQGPKTEPNDDLPFRVI